MAFLKNIWYVAMWADDLKQGEIVARRITDIPLALYRKEDGGIAALVDACPHRFAPLSRGKILAPDRLRCPYHGLEFDSGGACVRNPHASGRIPPAAKISSYSAIEKHSLIWVWMGDQGAADPGLIPDFSILTQADPQHVSKRDYLRMDANYILITENLLDLSHASILHEGILGNADTIPAEIKVEQLGRTLHVTRFCRDVAIPGLFDLLYKRQGGRVDHWTDMRWDAPGCLLNYTGVTDVGAPRDEGGWINGCHFLTPETEYTTIYHFCAVRGNPRSFGPEIDQDTREKLSNLRRMAFEDQDGVIIAAQQRNMLDKGVNTDRPALLEVDAGPVRFTRILDEMLHAERTPDVSSAEKVA